MMPASASPSTNQLPPSSLSISHASSNVSLSLPSASSAQISPTLPHSPETQRQIGEARAALEASIQNIGSQLDGDLKSRAQNLHTNSTQLEKQQKDVVKATEGLRKEGEKLQKLANEGQRKVKELGNVQNWAEMLERDFLVLQETVRLANEKSDSDWETSSYSGSEDEDIDKTAPDAAGEETGGANIEGPAPKDVDVEGDTHMDDINDNDMVKESEQVADTKLAVELSEHEPVDTRTGSSTTTVTETSLSDPSSSSINTANSAVS